MQIRTILYQYIKTLIKHVFLLNFTYELLMSFRIGYKECINALGSNKNSKQKHAICNNHDKLVC